jgi:hypothetical protein
VGLPDGSTQPTLDVAAGVGDENLRLGEVGLGRDTEAEQREPAPRMGGHVGAAQTQVLAAVLQDGLGVALLWLANWSPLMVRA